MSSSHALTVYVVRSARTAWQEQGRVQGNTNLPASPAGLAEAMEAATNWNPPVMPTCFCCGVDEASQQTTALFAGRSGGGKIREIDDLAEANLGLWQGLTEKQLADRYPKVFSHWKNDPTSVTPPQGEALELAHNRLASALGRLMRREGAEPLVLVLRPLLLAACHRWLADEPLDWKSLHRSPPPMVHRFDLQGERLRTVRAARRKKTSRPATRSASA